MELGGGGGPVMLLRGHHALVDGGGGVQAGLSGYKVIQEDGTWFSLCKCREIRS